MKQQLRSSSTSSIATSTVATMKALTGSVFLLILGLMLVAQVASGMSLVEQVDQSSGKPAVTLAVIENPEIVSRVLESLLRSVIYSASIDTGIVQQQQQSRKLVESNDPAVTKRAKVERSMNRDGQN